MTKLEERLISKGLIWKGAIERQEERVFRARRNLETAVSVVERVDKEHVLAYECRKLNKLMEAK
jgi:hypothetical protein